MLKLKLSKNPKEGSCLIGYYTGTEFTVGANLGLRDVSYEWAENRTGHENISVAVSTTAVTADAVTSGEVVMGIVSARSKDLVDPTPLPFGHEIGSNTAFGANQFRVYSDIASDINPTTADLQEEALSILKREIKLLDITGEEVQDIVWDLWFGPSPASARVAVGSDYGWKVYILVDRPTTDDRPLLVQYNAIDTVTEDVTKNKEELLNADTYMIGGDFVATGAGVTASNDYSLEITTSGNYELAYDPTNRTLEHAMAIAFWGPDDSTWTWEISGTDLILDDGAPQATISITGKTVKELVQAVNAQNLLVKATLLLDYPVCDFPATGQHQITGYGSNPLFFDDQVFVYYPNETKFYVEKPTNVTNSEEWYCEVTGTPIIYTDTVTSDVVRYEITEKVWMPFSPVYTDKLEVIDEPAHLIDGKYVSVRRNHLEPSSIVLKINGTYANSIVEDYDAVTGVLKLSKDVLAADNVSVSYAWDPKNTYIFEGLNLNVGQLHVPDGYRLYFGIYIVPASVNGSVKTKPTIGWAVSNRFDEMVTALASVSHAQLLGVFQVSAQSDEDDVKILDIRSQGGGLKDTANIESVKKRAPESEFFADIGYWDGEPYAGHGVIVVLGPSTIIGDGPSVVEPAPADGGFADQTGNQNLDDIRRRTKKHVTIGMHNIIDLT